MREIKFRAKEGQTGKWAYGTSELKTEDYHSSVRSPNVPLSVFWAWVENGLLDPETVGQYTDRKDKDGQELYEGDVVNCLLARYDGQPVRRVKGQIVRYGDDGDLRMGDWSAWFCSEEVVIGNLWDNPELLEGG